MIDSTEKSNNMVRTLKKIIFSLIEICESQVLS